MSRAKTSSLPVSTSSHTGTFSFPGCFIAAVVIERREAQFTVHHLLYGIFLERYDERNIFRAHEDMSSCKGTSRKVIIT